MSWQNVALLVALMAAVLLAPRLGADPQAVGVVTTLVAAHFVSTDKKPAEPSA